MVMPPGPDDPHNNAASYIGESNAAALPPLSNASTLVNQLQAELERTRFQLRQTIEQHETTIAEYKAANQELQLVNAELRAASDELEISKEEIQAINEQLSAVNQELKHKISEVNHAHNNLQNLITSTQIGTLFLDRHLRIKLFTPNMQEIYHLIPADLGRPLNHLTHLLMYDRVVQDAAEVLQSLATITREVQSQRDRWYLMRLLPYRTIEDRIDGVVMTFVDITQRKQTEATLREREADFRASFEIASVGEAQIDLLTGRMLRVNTALCDFTGYSESELLHKTFLDITELEDHESDMAAFRKLLSGETPNYQTEKQFIRKDGAIIWGSVAAYLIYDEAGQPVRMVLVIQNIGKRKQAEATLRLSEERYRTLFESIDEGFCVIELIFDENNKPIDYCFLEMNPAFERHSGLEQAIGKTARQLVPNLEDFWFETYGSVALTGETIQFEHHAEQMGRWFEVYASRVGDSTSRRVALVFKNITQRKQIEQALQASEEQSRNILESITDAFFAVDRDWRFTYVNQQAERLLNSQPGELIGKILWDAYPGLVGSEFEQIYLGAAHERIAASVTSFYPDHNRWYEVHAYPAVNGITAYFRNVTARKQVEEALRESEERLRRSIAIETVGVIFFKADGQITDANNAFLRMSGYTREDLVNGLVRWDTQTPPEWMPQSLQAIEEFFLHGRTTPYEKEYIRKDGSRWWTLLAATRLNAEEGVEFVIDITESKAAEVERARLFNLAEQSRQQAEAALRTRDQFLSIASHELRTPLTSLIGYTHLLHSAVTKGKGDVLKMSERISYQAQRLNSLIEQLLDVSRLQRGQFAIEYLPFDVVALTVLVVDEFRVTLPPDTRHPIELCLPDQPVLILGDANRLEQVLQNLLSNAVKYSPAGGSVRVQVMDTGTEAVLEIEDHGIGIPAQAQDRLFEPFYRASNVGSQVSGFGIGLHIVREIVQRHNGCIEVISTEGVGSTFRVTLPLLPSGEHPGDGLGST